MAKFTAAKLRSPEEKWKLMKLFIRLPFGNWKKKQDYLQQFEIAGSLTPLYIPPSNFMVYPVVGFLNSDLEFSPNISEVKRILEIPLSSFFVPEIIDAHAKHTSVRGIVTSPAYCVGGIVIWGASAMILSEFLALFEKS